MNHTWPKIIFHLFNAIDYKAGKRSTIYLPEAPDASWGRFYRLDHEDGNKVVFEREGTPKAYVPYVFFPYQDLHIDISKMDLSDHHDQVQLEHISFSSAINYIVIEQPGSLVTQSVDEIRPYAEYSEEGAIVDYLSPAPMHAILSWRWYDFFEGNKEDGTWQEVSPELIFHDPEPTTYHPLAKEGKVWNFKMCEYLNNGVLDHYYSYIVKGDTTIHEKTYKKLYMQYDKYNIYTAALRDEGCRAYIVPADSVTERFYYDLELTERVQLTYGLDARPYKSPSTRDINGITLNCLEWLIGPTSVHMLFLWIEGIGCTQDFFKCHLFGPSDGGTVLGGYGELVSCIEDGVYLYGDETSVPVTTRTAIPLHYEGKDGYDGEASNIWLETDGTNITFFLHDVKDVFTLYLNNEPLQIDFTGDMFKSFVPSPLSVNYRMEGPNEIFSVDYPQPEDATYHPFVERGKHWCVHGFSLGTQHTVTDYYFSDDESALVRNGHSYEQLCARTQDGNDKPLGWFREENQRIYMYNEEEDKEVLTYDFSLKVGDRFEPEYGDFEHCEVTKIDYLMVYGDSLKVINFQGKDKTSLLSVLAKGRWIEGIGSEMNPLDGLFSHSAPNSWSYQLAYVSGSRYWPFTFSLPFNGWWGQKLTRGKEDQEYEITHSFDENDLHYELVPDPEHDAYVLHVSGIMWLHCGGDLYIYCRSERTEDNSAYKLYLQLDYPAEVTTCKSPYHVDLSFPYFEAGNKYIAVDERGEHPVAVRDAAYRPFIEEGKVWKVGWFPGGGNTAQKLDYYYFDGDSITIGGKVCLKMRCRHEANEQWGNPEPWSEYVGAFYEEGRKVFCVFPDKQDFELLYDFESNIGDTIQVYGGVGADQYPTVSCIISKREYINDELFKGGVTYVDVEEPEWDNETQTFINKYNHDDPNRWMEGVGSGTPFANIMFSGWDGFYDDLMSCTVGDEILYYNPYLIDGVTPPDGAEVKRQWLDFTHIKKPRPRAPRKERYGMIADEGSDAETLTGEYSIKDLFVNFKPLSGAYMITVIDANDQEVYHKEVQTDNVIALNTALSTYAPGTYTLTVENAEEAYTATFILDDETAVRDIPSDAMVNSNPVNGKCYDLSGRQIPHSSTDTRHSSFIIRHLPKGVYIRDGRKVVVK